jgi:hypothetical protein
MTSAKRLYNVRVITTNNNFFGVCFSSLSFDLLSRHVLWIWRLDDYQGTGGSVLRMNMEWSVGVDTELQ